MSCMSESPTLRFTVRSQYSTVPVGIPIQFSPASGVIQYPRSSVFSLLSSVSYDTCYDKPKPVNMRAEFIFSRVMNPVRCTLTAHYHHSSRRLRHRFSCPPPWPVLLRGSVSTHRRRAGCPGSVRTSISVHRARTRGEWHHQPIVRPLAVAHPRPPVGVAQPNG